MPAYISLGINITDPEVFDQCRQLAPTTIKAYGGEYIARGGNAGALEGNWTPNRIVIQGFDGVDTAKA